MTKTTAETDGMASEGSLLVEAEGVIDAIASLPGPRSGDRLEPGDEGPERGDEWLQMWPKVTIGTFFVLRRLET